MIDTYLLPQSLIKNAKQKKMKWKFFTPFIFRDIKNEIELPILF